jgi:hypothetical protein
VIWQAMLEVRYRRIRILSLFGKQQRFPALTLTVIRAQERMFVRDSGTARGKPKNRKKIDWKLFTRETYGSIGPNSNQPAHDEAKAWHGLGGSQHLQLRF